MRTLPSFEIPANGLGWRNKALCCTPNDVVLSLDYDADLCAADPWLCLDDLDDQQEGTDSLNIVKRTYKIGYDDSTLMYSYDVYTEIPHQLFERVGSTGCCCCVIRFCHCSP